MKKGDRVAIYQDMATKTDFEGFATIVDESDIRAYFGVIFDDEPETTYWRFIYDESWGV